MISAYEDWYLRRNWYALLVAICANKGPGTALRLMGVTMGHEPESEFRRARKYPDELGLRLVRMRDAGATWHQVADELGIYYGSAFGLYDKTKRRIAKGELHE